MRGADLRGAARMAGLADTAVLAALRDLIDAEVIEPIDVHLGAMLAARFGETDPVVLQAVVLATRAPRAGHVCVDLLTVEADALLPEGGEAGSVSLPVDREDWCERVRRSALVREGGVGEVGAPTPLVLRGSLLYTDRYFVYEAGLAEALRVRFREERGIAEPELLARGLEVLFGGASAGGENRQRLAAEVALRRGMTVISGGPGTGKTWTVRNVLTLIYAQAAAGEAELPRFALAAPTGKAASRVVESIQAGLEEHLQRAAPALPPGGSEEGLRAFLESSLPSTLHRLLGWRPDHPTRFRHDADHPLALDLLIVDEASMVDLAMMAKLVDAVPPAARLILLGDRHQLASVEAGSVLADLCRGAAGPGEGDAVVFLTHSRRFGADSGIGRFATATVEGRIDDALAALPVWKKGEPGGLFVNDGELVGGDIGRLSHGPSGDLPTGIEGLIVSGYRPYLERLGAGCRPGETLAELHAAALELFDGFRVLCAHRRGRYGVQGMDRAISSLLREAGLVQGGGTWWLGRPVMVTRNDYGVRRFNGDIGLVVRDTNGAWVVAFPAEGGGVSYLSPVRLPEHQTVFAMTIHKSQGSEFRDVLVVLPEAPSAVLTRELIYTGVTRAKLRVTVLAEEGVLRQGLERRVQRASGLAGLL